MWRRRAWFSLKGKAGIPGQTEGCPATSIGPRVLPVGSLQQRGTFATIRHRTVRAKGCLSNKTALAMVFKLAEAAEKSWRRLDGHHHLLKVIRGVTFTNGIEDVSR